MSTIQVPEAGGPAAARAPTTRPPDTPERRVTWTFIALYALAYGAFWMAVMPPVLVTLALKVNHLVGTQRGAEVLGVLLGTGALVSMISTVMFGKMSDRTRSRFGMRRPWLVVGGVGGLAGAAICAYAGSIPVLFLGVWVTQMFFSATGAVLASVLPDQVPPSQYGLVSGIVGLSAPVGTVAGAALVHAVAPNEVSMFLLPPIVALLVMGVFTLTLDDRRLRDVTLVKWSIREVLVSFYVSPRQHPDFAWTWLSRFLIGLAIATLTTYQAFYLLEHLKVNAADISRHILLSTLVLSAATVVASAIGGKLSDLLGRRRVFVIVSAAICGVAALLIADATTITAFLIAMGIGGLAWGVYNAVDLALVAAVLPSRHEVGKDMGVFNMAATLPQTIAPAIAPMILAATGHSYSALYSVCAGCALAAALAIWKVRGVR